MSYAVRQALPVLFTTRDALPQATINAIGINHLFVNISDGDLTYFRTEILIKMDSLMQDNMPWVNDKVIFEEKADVVFGEMETACMIEKLDMISLVYKLINLSLDVEIITNSYKI